MKRMNKKAIYAAALAGILLLASQACTDYTTPDSIAMDKAEGATADKVIKKVLWINIDGAVSEVVKANMPQNGTISGMLTNSKYMWTGLSDARTLDEERNEDPVTWATMLTGVLPEKHLISDESYIGEMEIGSSPTSQTVNQYPNVINYMVEADPTITSLCVTPWENLNRKMLKNATRTVTTRTDAETKEEVLKSLKENNYRFTLVSFAGMLNAGKTADGGFTSANQAYIKALQDIDSYIGEFLQAIKERDNTYYEDWLVCITSNHGGNAEGHYKGMSEQERNIFGIFYFPHYTEKEMKGEKIYATRFHDDIQAIAYDTIAQYYPVRKNSELSLEFVMRVMPRKDNGQYSGGNWDRIMGKETWGVYRQRSTVSFRLSPLSGSGEPAIEQAITGFNDQLWHNYAISLGKYSDVDGGRAYKIYYDGLVQKSGKSFTLGTEIDSTSFVIGGGGVPNPFYIAEVRIWNKVLDDTSVAKNAGTLNIQESDPNYPYLMTEWKFSPECISDTILKNRISGMLALNIAKTVNKKVPLTMLANTLQSKRSEGNIVMENILIVPQILYWFGIARSTNLDGYTFLNSYSLSEEWREIENKK